MYTCVHVYVHAVVEDEGGLVGDDVVWLNFFLYMYYIIYSIHLCHAYTPLTEFVVYIHSLFVLTVEKLALLITSLQHTC